MVSPTLMFFVGFVIGFVISYKYGKGKLNYEKEYGGRVE